MSDYEYRHYDRLFKDDRIGRDEHRAYLRELAREQAFADDARADAREDNECDDD